MPRPSAAPRPTTSEPIQRKPDFKAWKNYELQAHLRELDLQVTGKRDILIERLEGHYAGVAQVKKGCSIAKTAAAFFHRDFIDGSR